MQGGEARRRTIGARALARTLYERGSVANGAHGSSGRWWLVAAVVAGCGGPPRSTVPLLSAAGVPVTVTPVGAVPLEVVVHGIAVPDPLPVDGGPVGYTDVEAALSHAVASAAVPWAEAHRQRRPEGYQLLVELVDAQAQRRRGRTRVTLGVRATLRARQGQRYLAQTYAHCREAALLDGEDAAPVIYGCMTRVSRDLAGWLGSVEP